MTPTKVEARDIRAFNKAYTSAVKKLERSAARDPNAKVTVKVGGKSFTAKAADVARSMRERNVTYVRNNELKESGYTNARRQSFVTPAGIQGKGPRGPEREREVTAVHELGLHGGVGERSALDPVGRDLTGQSHAAAYDRAADELLGDQ